MVAFYNSYLIFSHLLLVPITIRKQAKEEQAAHHYYSLRHWSPKRMYKNSASFALYPQHDAMFNVEQDLFLLSVVSDKCMQCVTVGYPTNQA